MEKKIINIAPTLTSKQKQTLKILLDNKNGITEVLYGGAAGGGKSYLGCLWIIIMCLKYPETRWLIGRSKLTTLKQTTLKTFFEVAKKLGLSEEDYKYNQQTNNIIFKNGSEVILKDLFSYPSDPDFDSLGSLELTGAFVDECPQISLKAKNIVSSRIRYKLDENNLIPKMYLSCNPSKGWTYNEFYKKKKDGTLEIFKEFIQAFVTDNNYISKHYVDNLNKLDEISKARLLRGEWEYSDSTSIFDYDSIIEMFLNYNPPTSTKKFISVDVARLGKDKTVILVWEGFNIIDKLILSKKNLVAQKEEIEKLKKKYSIGNENIVLDSDGVGGGLCDMIEGCVQIVNNSKPIDGDNYQNLKTQLYFKLADKINNKEIIIECFDNNEEALLTQELAIIKRTKIDLDGKVSMTSKDIVKQQLGRSPDFSDALAYRMYFELKSKEWDYEFDII